MSKTDDILKGKLLATKMASMGLHNHEQELKTVVATTILTHDVNSELTADEVALGLGVSANGRLVGLVYHDTLVACAVFDNDKLSYLLLNTGGYDTRTTKARMNTFVQAMTMGLQDMQPIAVVIRKEHTKLCTTNVQGKTVVEDFTDYNCGKSSRYCAFKFSGNKWERVSRDDIKLSSRELQQVFTVWATRFNAMPFGAL